METEPGKSAESRGTRRDQQKRETREVIRGAARTLFDSDGFEATTIRDIATKAGVGVGTVHLHFQDKETLLLESLIDDLAENDRKAWASMPRDAPVKEQLLHLVKWGYGAWTRRPSLSRIILRRMVLSQTPELDRLRQLDDGVVVRIAELLKEAQERDEVRPDVDAALATKAIFSFYLTSSLGWLGRGRIDEGKVNAGTAPALDANGVDALVDEATAFLDLFFDGIGSEMGGDG